MPEGSTTGRPPSLYVVNAPVDLAMMGGVSIVAAIALCWAPPSLGPWPMILALVCNWPHFAATNYRLYHSRTTIRQFPATAFLAPVAVVAGAAWAFAEPVQVAPLYVKIMLLWSPYHFSGQTLGLCLTYARRAGWNVSPRERQVLEAFLLTTYLASTAHLETGGGMRDYAGLLHPRLGLAAWVAPTLDGAALLCGLLCASVWGRRRSDGRRVPLIVLLPAAAQCVWFVLGRGVEAFQLLVPFFHSLEYLFIAWAVHLKERLVDGHYPPSPGFVRYETLRWWLVNAALGIALFVGIPYACAAAGWDLGFAMAVGAAAVQLHHFFVDGVIWKLRTARTSSPLLVTIRECSSVPDRLPAAA